MSEQYLAIDNCCAWPNLTRLADSTILAMVFNQPCHAQWEGDVACWASSDGGRTWAHRGQVTDHAPSTNHLNVAAGLAGNGDLVVLVSGWTNIPPQPRAVYRAGGQLDVQTGQVLPARHSVAEGGDNAAGDFFRHRSVLPMQVCRSHDGGVTWRRADAGLRTEQTCGSHLVPYGDVGIGHDGALYAAAYSGATRNYLLRSGDEGVSWQVHAAIAQYERPVSLAAPDPLPVAGFNETAIVHLGEGRWLAALRTHKQPERFKCLQQYRSEDDGRTWHFDQDLTLPQQIPGHYLRLADGRILLTYGTRSPRQYGVAARMSRDEGQTWSPPLQLIHFPDADGGYPSSVQNDDGMVVTAYYAASQPMHHRYHMGVILWDPNEVAAKGW